MPDEPPPIYVAAAGPRSADMAGRYGDALITISPQSTLLTRFDEAGGKGKPCYGQMTMCWAKDIETAWNTASRYWRTSLVPGPLHPNRPLPSDSDSISRLGSKDVLARSIPMGPNPETSVSRLRKYVEAGFDHIFLHQIGHDQEGFLDFFSQELRPRLERSLSTAGADVHGGRPLGALAG